MKRRRKAVTEQEIAVMNRERDKMRRKKEAAEKGSPERKRYTLLEQVADMAVTQAASLRLLDAQDKEWLKVAQERHREKMEAIRMRMETEEGYSEDSAYAMQRHQLWADAIENYRLSMAEDSMMLWGASV